MITLRRGVASAGTVALAMVALSLQGCGGDELPREAISGTVTFEDKPLAKGQIQFFPTLQTEHAIASGAPISGGSFSIPRSEGLVPGTYKVSISSEGDPPSKAKNVEPAGDMPGLGPLHAQELIPLKYNTQTTLTAEVTKGGKNTFEYKLTK